MWMKDQIEKKKEPSRLLQENAKHLSLHPCMTIEQENWVTELTLQVSKQVAYNLRLLILDHLACLRLRF